MSAANPESVIAANRDALRASASASVAHSAALPATAAASSPVVGGQLAAVSQRITDVEKEIDGTKIKIERKETARDACLKDDPLRAEYNDELKSLRGELTQLRTKEEQLRDEAKEIRAALRHQSGTFVEHGRRPHQVCHRIESMLTAYLCACIDFLQWTSSPKVSQVFD